ncbi:hypothetical protein [Pseudodesulfovibrio tunisiensis]|uniref:hypothetical protein n=1 Tax=Pseudodesulfovibrio tunisiensis TaxID=463192 RepID=UPI001FB4E8B5|nr:hypothetical protein [Pseudodesulfovibrio tunisiensis]
MTKRMPLAFDGGNVMFDRLNEKTVAFLGLDALTASEAIGQAFGAPMDRNGLLKAFRNFFNVDEIHVAGTGMRQPEVMFHLDQAMTLLPGHRAAILTPEGPLPESETDQRKLAEVKDFLKQLRTLLDDLGYATVDLKTSVSAILGYRFPNLAAYTDRDTGTPTVLFSAYADDSAQDKVFRKENRERLHALGFVTREVSTSASQNNGGIHCLYNTM